MKGSKPFPFLALSLCLCALLSACAGGHPPNSPGALNIANSSMPDGVVQSNYSVTLIPSGGLAPYTWTLTGGALPGGLTLSSGGVISGTPLVSDLDSSGNAKKYGFTVKVTDSQTPTAAFQTGNFSITINPLPIVTSTTLPNASIGVSYSTMLTNSGGAAPFTWSVTAGSLPPGLTLNASGAQITGTPSAGSAGNYPFTIQVTDRYSNTASANVSIKVTGRLQGNFAFSFNGYNNGQPFYIAGSFVGDGGGNLNGVLDQNPASGAANGVATNVSFTGTYSVGTNNLGNMSFIIGSPLNVTYNFALAVSLQGDVRFLLGDPNTPNVYGSGVIKSQNISGLTGLAGLLGNWAFGFFGVDNGGNRSAGAGSFILNSSGTLTTGIEDTNDNGTVQSQVPISGSFMNLDITTGRGTATLNAGANVLNYAFYVVSVKGELIAVQTDPVSSGASLSLVSLLQPIGNVTGGVVFSNALLNAASVVELNGYTGGSSPLPDEQLGVSTFDGAGHITLYQTDENKGGTVSQNVFTSGTYSVDPTTGRVTVAGLGTGSQPVWYVVNANHAFVIGTDSSVTQGLFEPQTGQPFSLPSFLFTYAAGTIDPVLPSVTNEVDSTIIPPPGGEIDVTYDTSGPGGPLADQGLMSAYALDPNGATTGRFILTANGSTVPTQIVYIITGQPTGGQVLANNKWAAINVAAPSGAADPNPRIIYAESTRQ